MCTLLCQRNDEHRPRNQDDAATDHSYMRRSGHERQPFAQVVPAGRTRVPIGQCDGTGGIEC